MVLAGPVSSEAQRAQLRAAAGALDPANVVDSLTVDAAVAPAAADVDRLAVVVEAMTTNLVAGTAGLSGGELRLDGVVRDAEARTAVEELAASSNVVVDLSARPVADTASARQLQDSLNEFAAAEPIPFEPGSIELTADAAAVIERIAARALALDAVDIVVVGYTDTDGSAETNQLLSAGRAIAVRDALVEAGLDDAALTTEGRGETEPVLGADGTEDKPASRRVEFLVAAR
jgi:OOP family OmpA-OmpF porin